MNEAGDDNNFIRNSAVRDSSTGVRRSSTQGKWATLRMHLSMVLHWVQDHAHVRRKSNTADVPLK